MSRGVFLSTVLCLILAFALIDAFAFAALVSEFVADRIPRRTAALVKEAHSRFSEEAIRSSVLRLVESFSGSAPGAGRVLDDAV